MNNRSKGRKAELEARTAWTERLNRFAAAKNAKQRQAALEAEIKINPGGALRDLLQAWGYSASSRGRKAKGAENDGERVPARQKLEAALWKLYGEKPAPVPSLYKKLAGVTPTTVSDACRICASLVSSWPEKLALRANVEEFAESFIRDLLADVTGDRSYEWGIEDMDVRVFNLISEVRVGVSDFIKDAGEKEGALIVAGARNILIGTKPVNTIQQFHDLTRNFIGEKHKGLLIFVFDAALFEAGEDGFRLLHNLNLLATAITAFALFEKHDYTLPIRHHKVDWTRWRALSAHCCVVIRRPTVIDPLTGEFLRNEKLDEFIAGWHPPQEFARLADLDGFIRFDSSHVLPRTYPTQFSENDILIGRDLYWDVRVRPTDNGDEALNVDYYTPSGEGISPVPSVDEVVSRGRGRPQAKYRPVEEDYFYVIKRTSPGPLYDDAQRAIYMSARGRLNLDTGAQHLENLNAASALRQIGYEVLPISIMLSMFPRSLHFAAARAAEDAAVSNGHRAGAKRH